VASGAAAVAVSSIVGAALAVGPGSATGADTSTVVVAVTTTEGSIVIGNTCPAVNRGSSDDETVRTPTMLTASTMQA